MQKFLQGQVHPTARTSERDSRGSGNGRAGRCSQTVKEHSTADTGRLAALSAQHRGVAGSSRNSAGKTRSLLHHLLLAVNPEGWHANIGEGVVSGQSRPQRAHDQDSRKGVDAEEEGDFGYSVA